MDKSLIIWNNFKGGGNDTHFLVLAVKQGNWGPFHDYETFEEGSYTCIP